MRTPIASSESVRKRMSATPRENTPVELALRSKLHRLGLRFRIHQRIVPDTRRVVDIVFPRARIAVFVDGCFWHGCPEHGTLPGETNRDWWREKIETNRHRDIDTNKRLSESGWDIVRVWEHDDLDEAATNIAKRICAPSRNGGQPIGRSR